MAIEPAPNAVDLTDPNDPNMVEDDDAGGEGVVEEQPFEVESEPTTEAAPEGKESSPEGKESSPAAEVTPETAEKPAEEEKPEEKKPDAEVNLEEVSDRLKEVLAPLTPEQKQELLGTHDKAFTALTHKKQQLREREAILAQEKRTLQERTERTQKLAEGFEALLDTAKRDPERALQTIGWTTEEYLEYLNSGKRVPVEKQVTFEKQEATTKLSRIEQENKQLRERMAAQEKAQAETEWLGVVEQEYSANRTHFPTVARVSEGNPRAVAQEVYRMQSIAYHQYGETLPTQKALGILEQRLQEQARRFGVVQETASAPRTGGDNGSPGTEGTREPNTLSGSMTSQRTISTPEYGEDWDDDYDPVVDAERKREAAIAAALAGKHK